MSLVTPLQEQQLEKAVRSAGERLMRYWPGRAIRDKEGDDLRVEKKLDGSVVTRADFESNEIVTGALSSLFPNDGILSEEIPAAENIKEKERLWIIDPLDGTQTFVDGNDDFSILVALCMGPSPKFGMMYFPARDQLALARHGGGAFINGENLRVSSSRTPGDQRVYIRNVPNANTPMAFPRWMDSGCALLGLGRGELDGIIIRLVSHREWDLAAPAVLIEEAGGRVTDEHGQMIRFNEGGMRCRYFVGSNGHIHDQLLDYISALDSET